LGLSHQNIFIYIDGTGNEHGCHTLPPDYLNNQQIDFTRVVIQAKSFGE